MTTRPSISTEGNWLAGIGAVALFGVLSYVFLTSGIPAPAGFPDASIMESIGFAMFNLDRAIPSEGFLVAFIIIAVVLDAALDGSLMLAKREEEAEETATDGGVAPGTGSDPDLDSGDRSPVDREGGAD